jgi:hypothetical protein
MSNRWTVRRLAVAGAAVATMVSVGVAAGASAVAATTRPVVRQAPAGRAFYNPPKTLPKGAHGKLIWRVGSLL